jgi:hypothetical protein
MGILPAQKVGEEIEKRLSEDPPFDIIQIGDVEFYQTSGYEQIVKKPKEKGDGNRHAGDIVQLDSRLISAEDVGIFGESDLQAREAKGDDAEGV